MGLQSGLRRANSSFVLSTSGVSGINVWQTRLFWATSETYVGTYVTVGLAAFLEMVTPNGAYKLTRLKWRRDNRY